MTYLRFHIGYAIPVLLLTGLSMVATASGQTVGEVVSVGPVTLRRESEALPHADGPIRVGDAFVTGVRASAQMAFHPSEVGAMGVGRSLHHVNLDENSAAEIQTVDWSGPSGTRFRFALNDGAAYALFTKEENAQYEITTPTAIAIVLGTALAVSYNGTTTDIVTLSGTVLVRSLIMRAGEEVPVHAGYMTTVGPNSRRLSVVEAPLERLQRATEGIEMIDGGRAESLTRADGVLSGREVLPAEQSTLVIGPHPEMLDPCPLPSAPTCIPPEPLNALGNLRIDF